MKTIDKKKIIGAVLAVAFIVVFALIPGDENALTHEAYGAIGIFLAAIVMWMLEVLPMSLVGSLAIILMPIVGVMDFKTAIANFSVSSVFFIFGSFGITTAMKNSTIPLRITNLVLKLSKGKTGTIILLMTLATGLVSSFMSSTATAIMFYTFSKGLLDMLGADPKAKGTDLNKLGKALGLSAPVAAGIGGFITPAGTPGNIIIMDLLAQLGTEVTFAQWTIIAAPLGIIALLVVGVWLGIAFKTAPLTQEQMGVVSSNFQSVGNLTAKEMKAICVIVLMIVAWFSGTWIPILNTGTVAILGLTLMFFPGIDVLNWEEFKPEANINIVLMMGTAPAVSSALTATGALAYIITAVFSGGVFSAMNGLLLLFIISTLVCVLRAFVPTPAAVASLFIPLMYTISGLVGMNPVVLCMIPAFWGPAAMLLIYTEPIFLYSYGDGYYSETDLLRGGGVPSLIMVVVTAILMMPLVSLAGLG